MKTADEILSNYEYDVHYYGGGRKHILEAMNFFSKKRILAYEEWRRSVGAREMMEDTVINTPEELYEKFKQENNDTH